MKKYVLLAARILTVFAVVFSLTTCGDFLKPGLGDEVDLEDPDVTIDSHRDGQYLSGQVTFEGTFADDISGDSIKVSTNGGSSFSSATRVDRKNGMWSHDVDTTQLADGEYEVRVRVTDTADKTTDAKILVYFDNTAPAILVRTPQGLESTAFNQTLSVSGDAYDPFGIAAVELELYETDGSGTNVQQLALRRDQAALGAAIDDGEPMHDTADGTGSWTYPFDTTLYTDGVQNYRIHLRATDRAGNTRDTVFHVDTLRQELGTIPTVNDLYEALDTGSDIAGVPTADLSGDAMDLTVDQDEDLPQFEFSIPSASDPDLGENPRATGSVSDDDGVVPESIEILIDKDPDATDTSDDDWIAVDAVSGSGGRVGWEHSLSQLDQGAHTLAVRAVDIEGQDATSGILNFSIDYGPPVLELDGPAPGTYHNANITVSGTVEDGAGLKDEDTDGSPDPDAVEVSLDDGATWLDATTIEPSGEPGVWNWTYAYEEPESATPPADGAITFRVRARDVALKSDTASVQVTLDLSPPVLEFLAPEDNAEVNGTLLFQGNTDDRSPISVLSLYDAPYAELDIDGGSTPIATLTDGTNEFDPDSGGNDSSYYRWYKNVDTTEYQAIGDSARDETFTIVASDAAGNTGYTEVPITVDQATDIPVFTIDSGSLVDGEWVYSTSSSLVGTVEDDDGIDPATAEYSLVPQGDAVSWQPLLPDTTDPVISKRWSVPLPETGGAYTLRFRVDDINATPTRGTLEITDLVLDAGPPSLTVDPPYDSATDTIYSRDAFTISGTISDPGGLPDNPVEVSVTAPGGSAVDLSGSAFLYDAGATPEPAWSQDVPIGDGDGAYEISVTGTDSAELTTTISRTVTVDTTTPAIAIDEIPGYFGGTIQIGGTGSDATSGVGAVYYRLNDGSPDGGPWSETDANTWSARNVNLELSGEAETTLTLEAYAADRAGNESALESTSVNVDRADPRAEFALADELLESNTDVLLEGIADDAAVTADRTATDVQLTINRNGSEIAVVDLTADAEAADPDVGTWSYTLEADPNGNGDHSADGLYTLELLVTDVAGKTSTDTRVVQIDTTGPTLTVDAPVEGDATTSNAYTVRGSSRDTGGVGFDGTADVEYNLDGGEWTELTLSGTSWENDSIDIESSEGPRTFTFRSTDKLGNETEVGPITLFYDLEDPAFGEFAVGTTDTQAVNGDLELSGYAYDSNALDSISVSVNGAAAEVVSSTQLSFDLDEGTDTFTSVAHGLSDGERILLGGATLPELDGGDTLAPDTEYYVVNAAVDTFQLAATAGGSPLDFTSRGSDLETHRWSYTFDSSGTPDDVYVLGFVAEDIAGKTTTATRTVRLDTTPPETLDIETVLSGWQSAQNLAVSGTAGDSSSGLAAVEYQINGGAWNLLPGTTSWNGNITFPRGNNTLVVRATDRAGNTVESSPETVDVDVDAPSVAVDSPSEIIKVNGEAALPVELSVSDMTSGIDENSNVADVLLKAGDTDFSSGATSAVIDTGDAASGTWTADIPASDLLALDEGQRTIHVRAEDSAGNRQFASFAVLIDKTDPEVSITQPQDTSTVNRTITVSGSASDTQGLSESDAVTLEVYNEADGGWEAGPGISGTFSWTATLDTTAYDGGDYDTDPGADDTQLHLRAVARDAAGNTATATRTVTVDQNADRPVIELSNIDVDGNSTLKLSRTIYGSVQDDDGPVTTMEVSLDGAAWTEVPVSGGSWNYDIPDAEGDGEKNLEFRVTDAAATPTVFETGAAATLERPRVLVDDTPTYTDTAVTFRLDTVTPEIGQDILVDRSEDGNFDFSGDEENLVTNMAFGGSGAEFVLRVFATDANGIGEVSVEIPGAAGSPFSTTSNGTEAGYEVFDTGVIDLGSAISDGSVDVRISVTDTSGLTSTATRTIIVDNTVPDISYLSPLETSIVNGDVEVRGTASDAGSGLTGVEYEIGYNADGTGWEPVSGSLFSWTIELTGSDRIDLYAGRAATVNEATNVITVADHGFSNDDKAFVNWSGDEPTGLDTTTTYYVTNATQDTFELSTSPGGAAVDITASGTGVRVSNAGQDADNDGIWDLPIVFRVTDEATNQLITTDTDYVLQVDPTGDIPNASVVYPDPDSTQRTLGGSIRISGTAEDDDGVAGVYMQIDVDGDGTFGGDDVAANGTDWYNGGDGRPVDGTVSWNQTINADGEFNPVADGPDPRPIHFRVRARDVNGLYGPWSASQLIEVDDDVPQIGSSQPLTLVEQSTLAEQAYVADRWVKGTWHLTGSVEDDSGIGDISVSGDVSGSLSTEPGWFSGPDADGNYTFDIPVTTGASAGRLSFTITATDNSDPAQQTSTVISVQADNQAPTSNTYTGETPIVQSNLSYTLESSMNEDGSGFGRVAFYFVRPDADGVAPGERIYAPMSDDVSTPLADLTQIDGLWFNEGAADSRPNERTLVDSNLAGNENVRVGGLVRIGGLNRRIVRWDSATGTLEWAEEVDQTITDYAVAYAMVVDNRTVETPLYSGDTLTDINNDDGDGMVESIERTGGLYQWTASIDSKNIPDGPIELHWVSFDEAGNYVTDSVTTSIANNRPLLAGIALGTDLDGNGTVEADEKEPAFSALDPEGNEQRIATVSSGGFVAKGITSAEIDVVGGNGALQYDLSVGGSELRTLQPLRADEGAAVQPVQLSEADLGTDTSGTPKNLVFTIWDSTEESTPGDNSLSAELTAPILVDLIDEVQPKVAIAPFFWNSDSDNSLYENSRENGHIEITGVVNGTDPDVSGQISIRGTAYDDQRLTSLWMAIDGFAFPGAGATSNTFDTDEDGVPETLATTYSQMATFAGGTWTGTDQWETEGWKFTVTTEYLDQSGHEVSWQLDWDSSRVSGVAAVDTIIRALAVDKRSLTAGTNTNASSETENAVPGDVTANNVPSYQFDVVPYITAIATPNRNSGGLKDNNIRSAGGRYSIIQGTDPTFISVTGFNLDPNAVRIVDSTTVGAGITSTSGVGLAYSGVDTATYRSFSLSNDSTASGYLEVFTNDIRSVNNVNDNDARGSYPDLNTPEELPNREPDRFETKNLTFTDDRYLRFFEMHDTGVKNGYYPEMLLDGDDPVFGYVDFTGGPNTNVGLAPGTGAGNYYGSYAMPQRARFDGGSGAELTTEYLIKASIWDQMGMARDDAGRFYHLSVYNRDNGGMSFIYDRYAELYADGKGWGTGIGFGGYDGSNSEDANNNSVTLETVNFGEGLLLGRYQNPRMAAIGDSTTSHAKVYMLYYDDNTTDRNLVFRNLRVGTDVTGGGTAALYSGGTSSTGDAYAQRANITDSNTSGRITAASDASRYFDMAVTDDFRVIIVYYDESAGRLKLRYSDGPVDGSSPTGAVTWIDSPITFPEYVGNYVSMTLDSNDGIHLSAYDGAEADLSYMFIDAYDSTTLNHVTVDSSFSVGLWTRIEVLENGGDIIPYIAYFNSSESGQRDSVKLAYSLSGVTSGNVPAGVENGFTTGEWEYLNVPAITPPQGGSLMFKQVNLDFDSNDRPVVGYLGTNLEFGGWIPE